MKINRLKINGIQEPVGYTFETMSLSWNVIDAKGCKAEQITVDVSDTDTFDTVLFHAEGSELSCEGVNLDLVLAPCTRYYVKVTVVDDAGETGQAVTYFETGKRTQAWQACWISTAEGDDFHPVFVKKFPAAKVAKARLYICGLGLYEAYLNGDMVGSEFLTPYQNDYSEHFQVQTYDVTGMLRADNELKIYLGNGWYKGRFGLDGGHCGDRFALIAELHITDTNGETTVLSSDDSWEYYGSDIEDSGIYDGEFINRFLWKGKESPNKLAVVYKDFPKERLIDRYSLPVRIGEKLTPVNVIHTSAGETVLDMGQNFAGWIAFIADCPAGTKIHLEFGEVLQNGSFYNDNYRTATGGFTYISDGRKELVRPHFTYFGFRYVKVTGWPGEIDPKMFTGCVLYSALEQTGTIVTGHRKVNQLISNCLWGQKSNFIDTPTDCPQRDERLGWTGDAQVFAPTASYNMDTRAFYNKFLWMARTSQNHLSGGVPGYIPEGAGMCPICAVWGDAVTFIPDTLWRFYHDAQALRSYYPMMKRWVEYVCGKIKEYHQQEYGLWDFDFQFGDWLALDGKDEQSVMGGTPTEYIASMYYYKSLEILAKAAEDLGLEEDAARYSTMAVRQKTFLLDEYFSPHGHLCVSTQAAYVVAIQFDVYRDMAVVERDFIAQLAKDDYKIRCGFVGAPLLCQALCKCGQVDLAYEILLNESYPGWLHCVNLGATTIWERWNSLLPDGSISGTGMNSLNHYSYGSVVEFLYAYGAGIRPAEAGYRHAIIAPKPSVWLGSLHASYQSSVGLYVSQWDVLKDGQLKLHIEVPFDCAADVTLPYSDKTTFTVGAGVYDYVYKPTRSLRQPYTSDCFLKHVFADSKAKQILLSKVPMAAAYDNDAGSGKKIQDMWELAYAGADAAGIQMAMIELAALEI